MQLFYAVGFCLLVTIVLFAPEIVSFLFKKHKKGTKKWNTKDLNTLYECGSCEKLSRKYQMLVYKASHCPEKLEMTTFMTCPHCERELAVDAHMRDIIDYSDWDWYRMRKTITTLKKVDKEDEWMKTHPDCFMIDKKDAKEIMKTIEMLRVSKGDLEEQKRFEEYNNKHLDKSSWIENVMQKNLEANAQRKEREEQVKASFNKAVEKNIKALERMED